MLAVMMRVVLPVLAALVFGLPGAALAARLALVIGNDSYEEVPDLALARADAAAYADFLRTQAFDEVDLQIDLGQRDFLRALGRLYSAIRPGDTVVFVYAGHGWSDGSQNFLAPVDLPGTASEEEIRALSVPLKNGRNGILDEIAARGAQLTVAIIDACRNNPFRNADATRAAGLDRGLAPITPTEGSFVVFSAGTGQTALDRLGDDDAGQNSVFTRYFLRELQTGQDLVAAMKATQLAVFEAARQAGHEQRPAYYDEVLGRACLTGMCPAGTAKPAEPPEPAAQLPEPLPDRNAAAARDWVIIKDTDNVRVLRKFAETYPDSLYAPLAEEKIADLEAERPEAVPPVADPGPGPGPDAAADRPPAAPRTELAALAAPAIEAAPPVAAAGIDAAAGPNLAREPAAAPAPAAADPAIAAPAGPAPKPPARVDLALLIEDADAGSLAAVGRLPPRMLQEALRALGLYTGAIDGIPGPGTRAGVAAFLRSLGASPSEPLTPAQTVALLKVAAETNDPAALRNLGLAYMVGIGVSRNRAAAERWLAAAIERGDRDARAHLEALRRQPP
jgi:hypothetical protein